MPIEFSGFEVSVGPQISNGTLTWVKTPGDEVVARRALAFIEDRRVLFGDRHVEEDEILCLRSVLEIRKFLTENIASTRPGKELEESLKAM